MDWDAVAAVAELVGSLAVVISVVYLAIQVRGQTHQSKLTATRELIIAGNSISDRLVDDKDFVDLFIRFSSDFEGLSIEEKIRISVYLFQSMRLREQSFVHVNQGNLDSTHFESTGRLLLESLSLPGPQQWWNENRQHFDCDFRG